MVYGTVEAYQRDQPDDGQALRRQPGEIPGLGEMGYIAMTAFSLNMIVAMA